jgi:hypothetical protein
MECVTHAFTLDSCVLDISKLTEFCEWLDGHTQNF